MTCRDCQCPTLDPRLPLCAACIAAERAWMAPYVAVIIDATQALGWDDLAREATRRFGLYQAVAVGCLPFDGERQ